MFYTNGSNFSISSAGFVKKPVYKIDDVGIAVVDKHGKFIDCNPCLLGMFGYQSKDELLEYTKQRWFVDGNDVAGFAHALKYGNARYETAYTRKGGEQRQCELFLSGVEVNGKLSIIVYMYDLMADKKAQEQIEVGIRQELLGNEIRAKTKFLARMSHELRTPLNIISGITDAQLLRSTAHDYDTHHAFENIRNASSTLLCIIDEILDLSKIQSGSMEIINKPYDIGQMLCDALNIDNKFRKKDKVTMAVYIDENLPAKPVGDAARMRQIITILVTNAFKYTTKGSVTLYINARRTIDSKGLSICVRDTGRGMRPQDIEAFHCPVTTSNEWLGLNIVRELAALMGGSIAIESVVGMGTQFTVNLPNNVLSTATIGRELAESLEVAMANQEATNVTHHFAREVMLYGRVLIVDDVESNLYVAQELMRPYGLDISTVTSGRDAIELIRKGNVYDIIFMDYMMPGLDGIETAKAIFKLGYTSPIVALTANALLGNSESFLDYGFTAFMSKPIDVRELDRILIELIRDKYSAEALKQRTEGTGLLEGKNNMLLDAVVKDVKRALGALVPLMNKPEWDENDYKDYTVYTHGMKSAMLNISDEGISILAKELETAGREQNDEVIRTKTPTFISELNRIAHEAQANATTAKKESDIDGDQDVLVAKLTDLQKASMAYNKSRVRAALADLNKFKWSEDVERLILVLEDYLPHSEFEKIEELVGKWL